MDKKEIETKIDVYRKSQEEWARRRQVALAQADDCLAKANACAGAIEALNSLLPATPIENVVDGADVTEFKS